MSDYDLLVLGAGPGGYVASIRAAQLGMKTAIVERENLGGVCLNWGCIPSKALLRNAEVLELFKRAEEFGITYDNLRHDFSKAIDRSRRVVRRLTGGVGFLLKKNGVEHITGEGAFKDKNTLIVDGGTPISADNIIIATGARPRELPNLPVNNTTAFPSKALLRNAEVLELFKRAEEFGISYDNLRHDFSKAIDRSRRVVRRLTGGVGFLLKKNGVEHITGEGAFKDKNTLIVDGGTPISADNIIIATGARPRELPNLPVNNTTIITSCGRPGRERLDILMLRPS